jgi:hypothetical protein
MQHHNCPGLCAALRKRAINPSIWFLPVARNRVPQYAGHALCRQHTEDVRIEQPLIQIAALPEWTKIAVRMGEPANRLLSIADFLANGAGVLEEPERHRVARERIAQLGLEVSLNSPEEFAVVIKSDTAKWAKVIRAVNIKAE